MSKRKPANGKPTIEVYVCTNDRRGVKKSCADGHALQMLKTLRDGVEQKQLQATVKVDATGCLGACEDGPSVMLFPQGKMYCEYTMADAQTILDEIVEFAAAPPKSSF